MANKVMREHMNERFGKVFNLCDNPPLPKSLNIELNNTCNHKCIFCPYHGGNAFKVPTPGVLDIGFVKRILKQAHDIGVGEKEVGFYLAGEPLLYKGLIEVVSYAKELGFKYTFITTNGALANEKSIRELVDAGLDSIRFSINGGNREDYLAIHQSDDFDTVISNIKFLDSYRRNHNINIALSTSSVITKMTKNIKQELTSVISEYVDDMIFIPVILGRINNKDDLKEKLEITNDNGEINKDFICPMLFDTMYINALGKVVPCCDAYDQDLEFYDLYKDENLSNAWNNEMYKKYRNIFIGKESDKGTICESCILRRKGADRLNNG